MNYTEQDLEFRKPVWLALSELFLDTDVSLNYHYVAQLCAESPYDIAELYDIMLYEVAPAVANNLYSVAGEWAGFDELWLFDRISQKLQRKSLFERLIWPLKRRSIKADIDPHWQILATLITQNRAEFP